MSDEPRAHPVYLLLVGICAVGTAPFLFIGSESPDVLGLPLWLWASVGFTLSLTALTSWGILRYWRDDEDDPPSGGSA